MKRSPDIYLALLRIAENSWDLFSDLTLVVVKEKYIKNVSFAAKKKKKKNPWKLRNFWIKVVEATVIL